MMKDLTVIKIGGKLLDDEVAWKIAMDNFSKIKGAKILVHGGGKIASDLCQKLGIKTRMIEGRRITDQAALEIATMVYAGLLNKQLVSYLQSLGDNAMGFSGADGNLILSAKRPVAEIDFGFVGDVKKINTSLITCLLDKEIVPVFCAITHNGQGQLLNTNADTIASVLATNLADQYQTTLKFCFEKAGVLSNPSDDTSVFPVLSKKNYLQQRDDGVISAGMIPKLDNAFAAKSARVDKVIICGINGIHQLKGTEICL